MKNDVKILNGDNMSSNKDKVCLVLEGGAMRGIYSAGVIDVFLKKGIEVDAIIGTSAGALFGINYVSKQKERVLRYNKHYCKRKDYMGLYSLITTGNIMNKDFCFKDLVYELDPFDFKTFSESKTKFYATVTNLETGEAEYPQIKNFEKDQEYLRASGSMPLVSKIVEIENKKYLDGGIADSIPVQKALDMGYGKVIVVTTRPIEYRKKKSAIWPYKLLYKEYPKFIDKVSKRYQEYNDTVENIINLEKEEKIFVIRPTKVVKISKIEKNPEIIEEQYRVGYNDALKKLESLQKYLNN